MTKKDYELIARCLRTDYRIYKNNRDNYQAMDEKNGNNGFEKLAIHNENRMGAIITLAVALEKELSKENPKFDHDKWNDFIFDN